MAEKKRVLMICLGNICRSPIAEAVFATHIDKLNLKDKWEVQSAALIGYHTGSGPDRRAMETLKKNGISNYSHKARQIKVKDFDEFDWIFGMDESNIEELNLMKPVKCRAKVELLGSYDPQKKHIIRDPYYDNHSNGFEEVYKQCERCVTAFLQDHN